MEFSCSESLLDVEQIANYFPHVFTEREFCWNDFFHACLRLLHSVPVNLCVDFKTFEKLKFPCERAVELPTLRKFLPNHVEISQIYSNVLQDLIIYYHLRRSAKNLYFHTTFGNDKCLNTDSDCKVTRKYLRNVSHGSEICESTDGSSNIQILFVWLSLPTFCGQMLS